MTQSTKTQSVSEDAKAISVFLSRKLKPLGFKKRRNGFNRRLKNGLIQQISIFSVGAYLIDHGKFYIHAGCYVPEAELYRRNETEPKWITDALCTIRGGFPENYLSLSKFAADLDMLTPHIEDVLEALEAFDSYDAITQDISIAVSQKSLWFETPQPIVKACIQIEKEDSEGASRTIKQYLTAAKAVEEPHLGHIEVVTEWAQKLSLL